MAPTPKQVEAAWDRIVKAQHALAEAISAYTLLRQGEKSAGTAAKELIADFVIQWGKKYGAIYVPNWGKDMKAMKTLLQTLTEQELRLRLSSFLASQDKFVVETRHNLSAFPSVVNKLTVAEQSDLFAPAMDCTHVPRCKSDQEHTRRKLAERR